MKILIVEDNPGDLRLIEKALAKTPYEGLTLLVTDNLAQALSRIDDTLTLCLLDLSLPDSFGVETLKSVVNLSARLPVIVLTGQDNDQLGVELTKAGAQDYMPKSQVSASSLYRAISHAIERKKLLNALDEKNKDLEDFAHMASHDLKGPLARMAMLVEMLDTQNREETEQLREILQKQLKGMNMLIDSVLTFSKVGNRKFVVKPVDMNHVLKLTLLNLDMQIQESQARISLLKLIPIQGDENSLVLLFQNLIGNAIKYRGKSPLEIEIKAEQEGDKVIYDVKDNGSGMTKHALEHLFSPFMRFSKNPDISGHGLGLCICQKIVHRHGGSIEVDSRGEGEGVCFRMVFNKAEAT